MEGLTSEKVEVRGKHVHVLRRGCGQEVLVVIVMLVLMLVKLFVVTIITVKVFAQKMSTLSTLLLK